MQPCHNSRSYFTWVFSALGRSAFLIGTALLKGKTGEFRCFRYSLTHVLPKVFVLPVLVPRLYIKGWGAFFQTSPTEVCFWRFVFDQGFPFGTHIGNHSLNLIRMVAKSAVMNFTAGIRSINNGISTCLSWIG